MHTYADESGAPVEVTAERNAYNRLTGISDLAADMQGKRPFGVEINNYLYCWPQYGISQADIIYEMETEGGITRMLALYADIREVERIGPLRSARTFIEAAMPFEPIIVHLGGSTLFDRFLQENKNGSLSGGSSTPETTTNSLPLTTRLYSLCRLTPSRALG